MVVDPSMLLKKEEWEKEMIPVKKLPAHYIAKFIFNYDESVEHWISERNYLNSVIALRLVLDEP